MEWFKAAPVLSSRYTLTVLSLLLLISSGLMYGQGGNLWEPANGPGQSVGALTSGINGEIYGAFYNQVLRSTDGGINWTHAGLAVSMDGVSIPVHTIARDSSGVLFACARYLDTANPLGSLAGLNYRSTDQGQTWELWDAWTFYQGSGYVFAFAVTTDNRVLVGLWGGLLSSSDGGASWSLDTIASTQQTAILALATGDSGAVFASVHDEGLFRSTDSGRSWQPLSPRVFEKVVVLPDGSLIGSWSHAIERSTDMGITWSVLTSDSWVADIRGIFCGDVGEVWAATKTGIWRSTDSGDSWSETGTGIYDVATIHLQGGGKILAGSTVGLLQSVDNGATWALENRGEGVRADVTLSGRGYGDWVFAASRLAVYSSSDGGLSWARPLAFNDYPGSFAKPVILSFCSTTSGTLWVGMLYPLNIWTSADYGQSWVTLNTPTGSTSAITIERHGYLLIGDGSDGGSAFRRGWNGQWTEILALGDTAQGVLSLAVDSLNTYYAGYSSGLLASDDEGLTWRECSGLNGLEVRVLAADRRGRVFAGTKSHGVFVSGTQGETWSEVSTGLHGQEINAIEPMQFGETLCATAVGGVFGLGVHDTVWVSVSGGLPGMAVTSLASDSTGRAYAATSLGLYRSVYPLSAIREEKPLIPLGAQLLQNYPNPFNPSTTIRYRLPSRSHVTITVFNTLGQQVATLIQGEMDAGYHEVQFDSSRLASGIYIYRLTAGNYSVSRKMALTR